MAQKNADARAMFSLSEGEVVIQGIRLAPHSPLASLVLLIFFSKDYHCSIWRAPVYVQGRIWVCSISPIHSTSPVRRKSSNHTKDHAQLSLLPLTAARNHGTHTHTYARVHALRLCCASLIVAGAHRFRKGSWNRSGTRDGAAANRNRHQNRRSRLSLWLVLLAATS